MITIRKSEERGRTKLDWLDSRHTFSFGDYYDPKNVGFRNLRVINEDRVQIERGFPTHGHQDMEIVTYVLEGTLGHKDSLGNEGRTEAGRSRGTQQRKDFRGQIAREIVADGADRQAADAPFPNLLDRDGAPE